MKISLNEAEKRLANYLAKARYNFARKSGIPDMKVGKQSCALTDLEGIGAEIAFCKHQNVFPDTQIGERVFADAFTIQWGGVDVKSTKYTNGHLLAVTKKLQGLRPHYYALLIGVFPEYRFVGYATAEELLNTTNIKDFGSGEGFALSQDQLTTVYENPEIITTNEGIGDE